MESVDVGGIRLTHPNKVLYEEQGLTKLDLARYMLAVANPMLPYVEQRPLAVVRCPEGRSRPCFFQKHASGTEPDAVDSVRIRERSKTDTHLCIRTSGGLLSLVQMGVLEIHIWASRVDRIERPDRMVLDLDPGRDVRFETVKRAARDVAARLREAGLCPFFMTTGGKGLHVVVPLERRHGVDEVKEAAGMLARSMAREQPDRFVTKSSKAARVGRIFIDVLRNARGATAIAPYSTRARFGAPVATPIRDEELDELESSAQYDVRSIPERLASMRSDPWRHYKASAARIGTRAWDVLRS